MMCGCTTKTCGICINNKETKSYLDTIEDRLLEARYRYYILDQPTLSDFEYDYLERYYEDLCSEEGVSSILKLNGVGFDTSNKAYQAAMDRVNAGMDWHSLWEKEMKLVWDRLGKPKYLRIEK